jgi:hypothetical protein
MFVSLTQQTNKKIQIMTTQMKFTGEIIKYENGKTFGIHTKMTKSGLRYYRYSLGRFFPISQTEINKYIVLE